MENTEKAPQVDILDEPYKGPGRFVTAAGQGAVAHYGFAVAGLAVGGLLTYMFHGKAAGFIGRIRDQALKFRDAPGTNMRSGVTRFTGDFLTGVFGEGKEAITPYREAIKTLTKQQRDSFNTTLSVREHGFGQWILLHTVGLVPSWRKSLLEQNSERGAAATAVGGLLGFAGFALSPIYYAFIGVRNANAGREQFERAKEEVQSTRAEYDALKDRYVATRLELEDLKTQRDVDKGKLKVAGDDTPRMGKAPAQAGQVSVADNAVDSATLSSDAAAAAAPSHAEKLTAARDAQTATEQLAAR